jgi:hypothetical protein
MSRALYRCVLRLHPGGFRQQFGDEMLWIFDEASITSGTDHRFLWSVMLLADAVRSLARQWLLRSGSWKVAVALAGALIQVTIGSLGHLVFGPFSHRGPLQSENATASIDLQRLVWLAVWTVSGIGVFVIMLATWVKKFSARRIRAVHL